MILKRSNALERQVKNTLLEGLNQFQDANLHEVNENMVETLFIFWRKNVRWLIWGETRRALIMTHGQEAPKQIPGSS